MEIKHTSDFNALRGKHRPECRMCRNSRNKTLKAANKNNRKWEIENNYGITLEEYNKCMSKSVVCEICGKDRKLVYDHDHNTMEFRGVLCSPCNGALGAFKDTVEGLEEAIRYLKRS